MATTYETSQNVSMDTLALIFKNGMVDRYGRVWPLAIFGRTHDGRDITAMRNVMPSLFAVRKALASLEGSMTHLQVGPDVCG